MKILLLEDDLILNEILEEHLSKDYSVCSIFDGEEAQNVLYSQTFDLLLLDVNVPGINGFELLKELRAHGINTPTIFITSLDMVDDIEKGFASGCDDYIKKPFELKELDLRIQNIKRLFKISSDDILNISKDIVVDTKNLIIKKDGNSINIASKELAVLKYLINNSVNPVSVDELSLNIWSYEDAPLPATIRTYIKNLRKILGNEYISNIRGVGYKFNSK